MNEQILSSRYKVIQSVKVSGANRTYICEDITDKSRGRFTVLAVGDHVVMHRFIEINDKADYIEESVILNMFSDGGQFYVVYPYVAERALEDFYMGNSRQLREREEICANLIMSCMTSNLPWPVLYLALKQREVHLAKDRSVYLSYRLDLSELDKDVTEGDCAIECAKMLVDMLTAEGRRPANSYVLLKKKTEKGSYNNFRELYKDLELSAEPDTKKGIFARIRAWFRRNRDEIFRVLLWICVILAVFVIITFLTNLLFGDVPWLRLFIRSFEQIGLESLLQ